jgi:hypothetical protein
MAATNFERLNQIIDGVSHYAPDFAASLRRLPVGTPLIVMLIAGIAGGAAAASSGVRLDGQPSPCLLRLLILR